MNRHAAILTIASCLLALLLAGGSFAQESSRADRQAIEDAGVANLSVHDNNVYASAQPTPEQLQQLADAGVRHIINLRPDSEQDWDEKSAAEALGIQYHSIPVSGRADLTSENAEALDNLLVSLQGQPVLVHCASSNRVGGLRAITAIEKNGNSLEEALAEGRQWGLTGMEPTVREVLEELGTN